MKKFLIALSFFVLLYACSSAASGDVALASAQEQQNDGQKIYKTYCVTCHGLYGNMGGSGAIDLTKSTLSLEERILVITNGRNTMASFKSLLSPEKIQAVAAYTLELKGDE